MVVTDRITAFKIALVQATLSPQTLVSNRPSQCHVEFKVQCAVCFPFTSTTVSHTCPQWRSWSNFYCKRRLYPPKYLYVNDPHGELNIGNTFDLLFQQRPSLPYTPTMTVMGDLVLQAAVLLPLMLVSK